MENAARALMIAAGILIAILIISVLVSTFTKMNSFQMSKLSEEEQQQLIEFNEQYTKYVNQYVYGIDVLTMQNKYANDGKVEVYLTPDSEQPDIEDNKYKEDEETGEYSNKTRYYKCIGVEYDDKTGMINKIKFKQIKLTAEVEY